MFQFQKYCRPVPAVLVALLAVGCSELPTQPVVEPVDSSSQAMRVESSPARVEAPGAETARPRFGVKLVKGEDGGSVTAGSFTVTIPAGAFEGFALVSVLQPDDAVPQAVLGIVPSSKNDFAVPVTLSANLPGLDIIQLTQSRVSELVSSQWHPLSSAQANPQAMTVSTQLQHFSTYRVDVPSLPGGGAGGHSSGGNDKRTGSLQD